MLNEAEVWLELYKLAYQNNHDTLSYFGMAGEADHLLKEYLKRYPTEVRIKDDPANQNITWANPNKQTEFTKY